jgi:hypothetical protein
MPHTAMILSIKSAIDSFCSMDISTDLDRGRAAIRMLNISIELINIKALNDELINEEVKPYLMRYLEKSKEVCGREKYEQVKFEEFTEVKDKEC